MNAIDPASQTVETAKALAELNRFASEWKRRQMLAELSTSGCFGWPGTEFLWLLDQCRDGLVREGAEKDRICDWRS